MTKPPESVTVTTGNGATITLTSTKLGATIEVSDSYRIVYTSVVTDSVRRIRFEVEAVRGKTRGV